MKQKVTIPSGVTFVECEVPKVDYHPISKDDYDQEVHNAQSSFDAFSKKSVVPLEDRFTVFIALLKTAFPREFGVLTTLTTGEDALDVQQILKEVVAAEEKYKIHVEKPPETNPETPFSNYLNYLPEDEEMRIRGLITPGEEEMINLALNYVRDPTFISPQNSDLINKETKAIRQRREKVVSQLMQKFKIKQRQDEKKNNPINVFLNFEQETLYIEWTKPSPTCQVVGSTPDHTAIVFQIPRDWLLAMKKVKWPALKYDKWEGINNDGLPQMHLATLKQFYPSYTNPHSSKLRIQFSEPVTLPALVNHEFDRICKEQVESSKAN